MEEIKTIEELAKLSEEDFMTGLLNRRGGIRRIDEYIKDNPDSRCAFIIFDGDNFKKINDTFGHLVGENALSTFGQILREAAGDQDYPIRTGGDEFVVFYKDVDIEKLKEKLNEFIALCNKASVIGSKRVAFTFSIGIAIFPDNGKNFDTLMKHADDALYKAKYDGRARYYFYSDKMVLPNREQFMFDLDEFSRGLP